MAQISLSDVAAMPPSVREFLSRMVYAVGDGAPTNAVTGRGVAKTGSIYIDRVSGIAYHNTGTQASPVWSANGTLSVGALSADATGRGYMAADYFNAATADAKFAADAIGEDLLTAAELTGRVMANVADDNVAGGIPVVHLVAIAGGANSNKEVTLTHKTKVLDAHVILKAAGTAGSVVTVGAGANAITNAMDISAAGDRDIVRAGEIDDANYAVAASGALRVTWASTGGDCPACLVVVTGVRSA